MEDEAADFIQEPSYIPKTLAASTCSHEPPTMFSEGLWESALPVAMQHALPILQSQLVSVFLLHYFLRPLHTHLRIPWLLIHGLVGIMLGSLLRHDPVLYNHVLNEEAEAVIRTITSLGYAMFMFLTGVKIDPSIIFKSGKQAWSMGFFSLFFPIIFCGPFTRSMLMRRDYLEESAVNFFSFTQSLTPFPVISCLLTDLKILNSELGRLASSSSLISFLMSTAFFMVFIFLSVFRYTTLVGWKTLSIACIFLGSIVVIAYPLMRWIVKQTPEGKPVKEFFIILITLLAILSAVISDLVGLEYMYGPFMLGLVVPDGPPLGSTLAHRLDTMISGMMVPLLMTYAGSKIRLSSVLDHSLLFPVYGIILLSILGKIAAGLVTAKWCKLPYKDCLALSIIMSAKGIVDISLYITCNDKKQMTHAFASTVIFSVLLTAGIIPYVVQLLYDPSRVYTGYQKRSIMHTQCNADLKLLVCVIRQDDALASIKFLEAYNPSPENPLSLHVLNLVELVGRATPLLIDHQLGQKVSKYSTSSGLRTQHILDLFDSYKKKNLGGMTEQIFTAVSSHIFMHDDITSLAFTKLVCFILLPFHRKWSNKGKVVLDDITLRDINCRVLDKAPCSVGVLVDRRKMAESEMKESKTSFRVAVLFIGGGDDREAVVLSKRMARNSHVQLTIIRFVSHDLSEDRWEVMLDSEALKELKLRSLENVNIAYYEEMVRDGPQTAALVREIENEFELIIVGRKHKGDSPFLSGLSEWSEFPELGPLGDLLASSDIRSPVSAIVVQQQNCR